MPAYKLAIFDFDGTLGDTLGWFLDVSDALAAKFGFKPIDRSNMDSLRHMSARELMKLQKVSPLKLPAIAKHVQKLMTLDAHKIEMFPGAADMLRSLHASGVRLVIVSSNSEENIRLVLGPELCALVSQFNCGASVFGKAGKFKKVLKAQGVKAAEAVSIGDELRDIDAAREVGLSTGAVCWGYTAPEALIAQKPDHMFHAMDDIVAQIG
ncbi:HAD hydrolase-like protein [Caulobacter mirabilis]|uniref:HAD family hydrolase n=1 Tax=Caulobacter mirabilis TaxID=69666 RepID=A0A2D2AZ45_9CAUL|nr:HAD hydrolase-like protein [Caulobacter mirabilis]ATQ43255.1 HAD family hydrolase [Caulobacter mirabilis]